MTEAHWTETGDHEVTIGISGAPGNWIVCLKRGGAVVASSASVCLEEAFADAMETSAKLVATLAR